MAHSHPYLVSRSLLTNLMKAVYLYFMLVCIPVLVTAQNTYLRTAMPFLRIAPDARASALGETGAATTPDLNSTYWNNAKLAFLGGDYGVSASYIPWLSQIKSGITSMYFTGFRKLDEKQNLGISVNYFTLGRVNFYDEVGNDIGKYNPNEFSVELVYARQLSPFMSLGFTGKFLHSDLAGGQNSTSGSILPASSFAVDAGWYYENTGNNSNRLSYGVVLSNIGPKIKQSTGYSGQFLPMKLRIGTALHFQDVQNSFNISLDLNKLLVPTPPEYKTDSAGRETTTIMRGQDPNRSVPSAIFGSFTDAPGGLSQQIRQFSLGLGFEYNMQEKFFLRAGYHFESASVGDMRYATTGFGYKGKSLRFDFSYIVPAGMYNPYKNTFRITLGCNIE